MSKFKERQKVTSITCRFKDAVADCVIATLEPIQNEYDRIIADKAYLQGIYAEGARKATYTA